MSELSVETYLPAPPERVWEMLTRFEDYVLWNPYLRIEGDAALNSRVRMRPHTAKGWSEHAAPARVSVLAPEEKLEIKSGLPVWSASTRFFHLSLCETGTLLRHGVRFESWLSEKRFAHGKHMHRLLAYYENFGKALASALAAPRPKNEPSNRHGRRAQRAKVKSKKS